MDQFHNELEMDIEFYSILLMGYLKFKKKAKSSPELNAENMDDKEIQKITDISNKDLTKETKPGADQSDGSDTSDSPAKRTEKRTASQVVMVNECRYFQLFMCDN